MATEVERLVVTLEAKLDRFQSDMARAQSVTSQRLGAMEASFNRLATSANAMGATAGTSLASGLSTFNSAAVKAQLANERLINGMTRFGGVTAPTVERATVGASRAFSELASKTDAATARGRDYSKAFAAAELFDGRGPRHQAEAVDTLSDSLRKTRGELKATTSGMAAFVAESTGFGTAVTGIGLNLAGIQLLEYAQAWKSVTRALDAGQQTFGVALKGAGELTDLANESRVDLDAYAQLFIRTTASIRDYGMGADVAAKVTSTLAKALKLGSASASEQASVLLQFSQALQKGKLDGDEFRSVMENAGVVQEMLAERLKVSKGELLKMAADGKLKIRDLIGAMTDGADKVDRIFRQMPASIDEAFAVMRNNVIRYIGQVDETTGVTNTLAGAMGSLARHIDEVAASAAVLGAALVAYVAPRAIVGIAALSSRLLTLPGILAGAAAAAVTFGNDTAFSFDRLNQALDQGADLASAMRVAMSEVSPTATTVSDQFSGLAEVLKQDLLGAVIGISDALTGQATSWDQLRAYGLMAVGALVGGVKSMYLLLTSGLKSIPIAAELAFKGLANSIIRVLNAISSAWTDGVNAILQSLNGLPGFGKYEIQAPQLIPEFDTAAAYQEGRSLSETITKGMTDAFDLKGFSERVQREADKVAFDRTVSRFTPQSPYTPIKGKPPTTTDDDAEKARRRFDKDLMRAEAALRMQQLEAQSIGRSTYETERLRVQTQLLNEARENGVRLSEADRLKIDAVSNAMAAAIVQTENMRAAYQLIADETKSFFSNFAKGIRQGQSASEALADGLDRIADKLIDMAVNDLVDAALGGLLGRGGPGAGASGGIASGVASLFGFASGGVMVPGKGPASLPRFARGGVSRSAAIFGEAGPEAAVPLPDGRSIPVNLNMPNIPRASSGGAGPTVALSINVDARGSTAEGAASLQRDLVPTIQKVVRSELNEAFDRSARFSRAGI